MIGLLKLTSEKTSQLRTTGPSWWESTMACGFQSPRPIMRKAFRCLGPLTRYVKLWVVYAPGMPGTFSPPPPVSDPDIHHGTCVTHVPWCMPGSLTSGFLWSRLRGKRSRCIHNPQFHVSGKRPMALSCACWWHARNCDNLKREIMHQKPSTYPKT